MDLLAASPRKRRVLVDDAVTTPKRQRILHQTPTPATASRAARSSVPATLDQIQALQRAITIALSQALAQSALSPDYDTGRMPNVVNHVGLASAAATIGLKYSPTQEDIRRLCWLWEWDAVALPGSRTPPPKRLPTSPSALHDDDDENPFLDASAKSSSVRQKDWLRGGMGFIVTPTTHLNRDERKRVPAYGIGVEVDVAGDIDAGLAYGSGVGGGGMASVARWTAAGEARKALLKQKIDKWIQLHSDRPSVPLPPLADLPPLVSLSVGVSTENAKHEETKKFLSSHSPGGHGTLRSKPPGLEAPPSPSRSASPTKQLFGTSSRIVSTPSRVNAKNKDGGFAIPFPPTPTASDAGTDIPVTPSKNRDSSSRPVTPVQQNLTTPTSARTSVPSTPTSVRTPAGSTPRRAALYERIRQKSLTNAATPTSVRVLSAPGSGGMMGKGMSEAVKKAAIRRKCLLGRLSGVAESVWMYFSGAAVASGSANGGLALSRTRRAKPMSDVLRAVVKSSPVPISDAEAHESLTMLTELCPFFLTLVTIAGEEWLEMPSSTSSSASGPPSSPGAGEALDEVRTRSPRRVKNEAGGLREVRERIRRELDEAEL